MEVNFGPAEKMNHLPRKFYRVEGLGDSKLKYSKSFPKVEALY